MSERETLAASPPRVTERREQLRRAVEDGGRLYRLVMQEEPTASDQFRIHGILTRELESALALVDELRDALNRSRGYRESMEGLPEGTLPRV